MGLILRARETHGRIIVERNAITGREYRPRRATACPSGARLGAAGWLGIRSTRQCPLAARPDLHGDHYLPPCQGRAVGGASTHYTQRRDAGGRSVGLERIRGAATLRWRHNVALTYSATCGPNRSLHIPRTYLETSGVSSQLNAGSDLTRCHHFSRSSLFHCFRISGATSRSRALRASTNRFLLYWLLSTPRSRTHPDSSVDCRRVSSKNLTKSSLIRPAGRRQGQYKNVANLCVDTTTSATFSFYDRKKSCMRLRAKSRAPRSSRG